jgi:hypothetical protein
MTTIVLTGSEILLAANAGIMRHTENIKKNTVLRYQKPNMNHWQLMVEGALGEMAVAKHLNIYWSGKGVIGGGDVDDHEVRTTAYDTGRLICHPEDKDNKKYWLVTGSNGTYTIRGWILGIRAKQEQYWDDPEGGRPAYFIPQKDLHQP